MFRSATSPLWMAGSGPVWMARRLSPVVQGKHLGSRSSCAKPGGHLGPWTSVNGDAKTRITYGWWGPKIAKLTQITWRIRWFMVDVLWLLTRVNEVYKFINIHQQTSLGAPRSVEESWPSWFDDLMKLGVPSYCYLWNTLEYHAFPRMIAGKLA